MGRMSFVLSVLTWNHESNQVYKRYPKFFFSRKMKVSMWRSGKNISTHTCVSKAFVTALHTSRKYFSRYLGKRVAKDDCSVKAPALLSEAWKGSIFH